MRMMNLNPMSKSKQALSKQALSTPSSAKETKKVVQKHIIIDDDDIRHIVISDDEKLRRSKIIFETNIKTDHSSSLNVADATSRNFLSYDNSLARSYEIPASVVKKDGKLYILTSAHHNIKKSVTHPLTQYTYKNLSTIYDFDFGSTEMLLKYEESDKDFINNVYPHGIGIGSDVWGFVNKTFDGDRLITEHFSLVTTEKGLVIYKMGDDSRVTSGKHYCQPIQFISGNTENTWGDVKTYDVTNMTLNFKNSSASKQIKRGTMIKISIVKRIYNGELKVLDTPVIVYGKVLEVVTSLTHSHTTTDITHSNIKATTDDSVDINIRMKTDFNWQNGDHAHEIEIVNKNAINQQPYSLPETIIAHMTIVDPKRNIACYFTKETKGRLLAIDLEPLLRNDKAFITYDYYDDENKPFKLDQNKITEVGSMTGSHDVYVNEEQGIMYNVGMKITIEGGEQIKTGLCYDLKENHLQPKPKSVILDFPTNYLHDIVVESYDRSEQHVLLGIPMNKTLDLMYIAIGSTGDDYTIYNITDLNNIIKISSLEYEGGGYYHQAWFTTDKRYLVTSDETQADNVKYVNRVPILRLYYDKNNEKLQLYHIQNVINPFSARNHNQYISNNVDMFSKNNNDFDDWLFGANYNSGIQAQSLKYKVFNRHDFDDNFTYETRDKPFETELVGFLDTEVGSSDYSFGGVWSLCPFWEIEKTASEIKYLSSGDHSMTIFQYKNGVTNLNETDFHNDGRVQKCHPSQMLPKGEIYSMKYDEARPNKSNRSTRIDGVAEMVQLSKKDGTYENVILSPVGYSDKLDVQIYYVTISNSNIEDFNYLECAPTIKNGEKLYAYCGNHKCEGNVLKNMATDHYRVDKGQGLDPDGYAEYFELTPNNIMLYASRVGEIITNLPARSGDSGTPVVNKANQFVGFINSIDVTGGNTGVVNVCDGIVNFLKPNDIPTKTTSIDGIEGIYNNKMNGIYSDDPTKLAVVAVNERTGKIYYYVSSSLSQYFIMDLPSTGYSPSENGSYKSITGKSYASSLFTMNKKQYYSRAFSGARFLFNAFTMLIKSKDDKQFLFAEECFGIYKNRGPRIVFLEYDKPSYYDANFKRANDDGYYYDYIKVYLVSENDASIDNLFTSDQSINPLGLVSGHLPKDGDIINSGETDIKFQVVNSFVYEQRSKPSWYYGRRGSSSASVYPFNNGVPALFPYYKRSADSIQNISGYDGLNAESPLKLTGFGESNIDQLNTCGLNIQLFNNKTFKHETRVTFSEGWNAVNNTSNIPFELGVSVISLNGKEVNSDNFEYLLHTIPYEDGKKVQIGTTHGEFELPMVRYKNNSHGII